MKLTIELDDNLNNDEIIIKCNRLNSNVMDIEDYIKKTNSKSEQIIFYKDEKEYFFPLNQVLFFEAFDKYIHAHSINEVYQIKFKLYELEKILPKNFTRISKSTILNTNHIYSITHGITSPSTIEFEKSHKKVYVSRFYYKELKEKLKERKNYEK